MKMYILIKEEVPLGFAMVAVAHAALAGYLKFHDTVEIKEWLAGRFFKAVCKANSLEFENAKAVPDHVVLTESALNHQEVAIVFKPRREWPKMFKALRLYKDAPIVAATPYIPPPSQLYAASLPNMPISCQFDLSEFAVIKQTLLAAARGPFFPDWEFQTLFGMSRPELAQIADAFSPSAAMTPDIANAINGAINNLLGYPHDQAAVWSHWLGVTPDQLRAFFMRWRASAFGQL